MTTIAADAVTGLMVSDSQWTDDSEKGHRRKVFRHKGTLIGYAGEIALAIKVHAWIRAGMRGKKPTGDVTALLLSASGISVWNPTDGLIAMEERQFAIGTGGTCARAAMLAGADIAKAVRIATQIDAGSGGRVRTYRLET